MAANWTAFVSGAVLEASQLNGVVDNFADIAIFNETQASGTNGGSSVTGSFIKRTLNTTVVNNIAGCSIASSVITLPAGTYSVMGSSTFFEALYIKVKLRNTTDGTDTIISQNQYAPAGVGLAPVFLGLFTIAASKNFEVQYRCSGAVATVGLGVNTSLGVSEIFTQIAITKVA